MTKTVLAFGIYFIWATGFSQSLSLKSIGFPFKTRPDMQIQWNVPSNAIPPQVWVYKLLPNTFSRQAITNMMELMGFTELQKTYDGTNGVVFDSPAESRRLGFYFPFGWIEYTSKPRQYGPTNLAEGVPDDKQMRAVTLQVLSKLKIKTSEIDTQGTNGEPDFRYYAGESTFYVKPVFITNLYEKAVSFRRSVDGMSFMGHDSGGQGKITFGEHGKITKMDIHWRRLKPFKRYETAKPETIIKWLRAGKAVQGGISMNELPIDWSTVKKLTVNEAYLVCYGGTPNDRSNWLMPYVALGTTVERENGKTINVEIDCPILNTSP